MGSRSLEALVATTVLLSSLAAAQVTELRKYNELEDPNTPVAGHAVVGVSIAPEPGAQNKDTLAVWLRGRQGQILRVDVTTANGRVQGEALVKIESSADGKPGRQWETLNVPKRYRKDDPKGLAVGIQTPNDPSGAFYVAAWGGIPNETSAKDPEIWLYVNRGRAPQAFLYWDQEKGTGSACGPAVGSSQLRFNTICIVKVKDIPANGQLTLVRRDGGNTQSQKVVLVW